MTTRTDSKATLRHLAALKLYANGATFDEVATECGYASRSGAYQAVKAPLHEAPPQWRIPQPPRPLPTLKPPPPRPPPRTPRTRRQHLGHPNLPLHRPVPAHHR